MRPYGLIPTEYPDTHDLRTEARASRVAVTSHRSSVAVKATVRRQQKRVARRLGRLACREIES